jgi:hypothetical protein
MSEIKTNKISSLDSSNSDITLDPNGTGDVVVAAGHKLGAGTASPSSALHVYDGSSAKINMQTSTNTAFIGNISGSMEMQSADIIKFLTSGANERMRLNTDGKLLMNTTSSSTSDFLQIETPASGGGHGIHLRRNDSNTDQQVGSIRFGNNTESSLGLLAVKTDGANNSGAMTFSAANAGNTSERIRIHSNGLVGINSSSTPAEDCQLFVNDVALIGGTNNVSGGFPTSGLGIITTQGSYCAVFYDDNNLSTPRFRFDRNGNLVVSGSISKGSGSFRIDHPLSSKSSTHDLVHSFLEGPQADLIYRGKVDLVAGSATVNIDTASGMTDGTFVLLCGDVQCFTSNEDGFTAVKGSVSGNTLTITAEDSTCTDTISWMVVGERKDQHMIDTTWTDDNGKVIVEPLKE